MREYGSDYKETITSALQSVYDSVDPNYSSVINNLNLECKDTIDLQGDGIATAYDATARINGIRHKLSLTKGVLITFYDEVDDTTVMINKMAADLWQMLECINISLSRLNELLSQTGVYNGVEVTPQAIADAAKFLDKAEKRSYEYWTKNFQNIDGSINEDAVEKYFSEYDDDIAKKSSDLSKYDAQTLALMGVVDSYIFERGYSDESLSEVSSILASHMFKQSFDGEAAHPQEDSYPNGELNSTVYFTYKPRESAKYFLNAYSKGLQSVYCLDIANIDGQKNTGFLKRSELITSLEAITSYDYLSVPVTVDYEYMSNPDNYIDNMDDIDSPVLGYNLHSYLKMDFPKLDLDVKSVIVPEKNGMNYKGVCVSVNSNSNTVSVFNAGSAKSEVVDVKDFTVVACKQNISDLFQESGNKIAIDQLNSFVSSDTSFIPNIDFKYIFDASRGDAIVNAGNVKKVGGLIGGGFGSKVTSAGEAWGTYSGNPYIIAVAVLLKGAKRECTIKDNIAKNKKIEETTKFLENEFSYSAFLSDVQASGATYYFNGDSKSIKASEMFYYSPAYAQTVCNYKSLFNGSCEPTIFDPRAYEGLETWSKYESKVSEGHNFTDFMNGMEDFTGAFQEYCGIDKESRISLSALTVEEANLIYEEYAKWYFDNPDCMEAVYNNVDSSYFEELKEKMHYGE